MSFVHLHVHSEYSVLDGLSKVGAIVARAKELGQPAIALTDHGAMYGVIDFFNAAKKAGVKPIIGMEGYLARRSRTDRDPQKDKSPYHLLLLAQTQTGYQNLLKLATLSQLEGYYYRPRVDKDVLAQYNEGIIVTTGCGAAEIPRYLADGQLDEARKALGWYLDVFGRERFFIELQLHEGFPELININRHLLQLAKEFNVRTVATNDAHYIKREDAPAQDIMLCIGTGTLVRQQDRMRMTDNSYYLKSEQEMAALFPEVPEALRNTAAIAEMCDVDLSSKGYHLPVFDLPEGVTPDQELRRKCEAGLIQRYGDKANDPEVRQRLEYELSVIHKMGFDTYFLIVSDLTRFAKEKDIWWNIRGSGASSIVAYTSGITNLDPLPNKLIFERFLNPGRISMPDIDMDFPDDRRAEMIDYAVNKYGKDKVAQIITFGTLGARAAIRDTGRALDIPLPDVDRVAKLVPNIPGKPVKISEAIEQIPELKELYSSTDWVKSLLDTAQTVEGTVRNIGTHAAGVVISDRPLVEYTPLARPTKESDNALESITQFEMGIVESIGLLKVDFLGLATLSIMRKACDLIKHNHGVELNLNNIPVNDRAAFQIMSRGDVLGLFQVEGAGMRRMLMEMKPSKFEHIIAGISLFRPGPMEYIPTYIKRLHGVEPVEYKHPKLEPILEETYGIIVYQEQIIQIAVQLAGYAPGEADEIRKAVGKKIKEKIEAHRAKFIKGAAENGVDRSVAEAVYADIEYFARYGFNKCLPADVEVIDADTGRLIRVGDLASGARTIERTLTCETDRLRLKPGVVTEVLDNGLKPVYRLTTQLGRQIEATANHPFYTFDGWRVLGELKIGEQLAVPRRLPIEGRRTWPDHEVIVLGHLLAEGNLCHPNGVYYYTTDEAQLRDYVSHLEQFDNTLATVSRHKSAYSVYSRRSERTQPLGVFEWAARLGILGKTARDKAIPDEAFELTQRQIGLLVGRMWEGDGHINERGQSLYYATASERLARQLQHLLLRLGIVSRLRRVVFPYRDGRIGYQVFITHYENLKAFRDTIACHFISETRRGKLDRLTVAYVPAGTRDVVPLGIKRLVRQYKDEAGLTWDEVREQTGVAPREFHPTATATKSGFTRGVIGRLAEFFDSTELRAYADSDIYWDKVVSIEYAGEKQTYDLTVADTHNFVANNFIVHNSHAADYAVMTCQTAYLKAHYPVEFMTALMTVEQSIEKIGLLIIEARRLGIDVLPPAVNHSDLDFTIETQSTGKRAIRFGMASIKGVGEGPVSVIREARLGGGPFKSLEDFCRRVDLRSVNRRALEALIKVGALENFGNRAQLLQMIDRLMGLSSSAHHAQDVGQMTLFGGMVDASETETIGPLPNIGDVPLREKLAWEKELIGAYVSEHPVAQALAQLQSEITHTSSELTEDLDGHKAVMIGAVVGSRTIQTKKGDTMGFIQLEDVQGTYECVAFPRTWKQTQNLWQKDKIVVVRGTIDGKGKVAKILLDSATDKPQVTSAAPDKRGVGIRDQGSGISHEGQTTGTHKAMTTNGKSTPASGNNVPTNDRPATTNGVQKSAVQEQRVSYQPAMTKAQPPQTNGRRTHEGSAQPAANNPLSTTNNLTGTLRSQRSAAANRVEFHEEVFFDESSFDEDPFAGEVFIPDMDDPVAAVAPVEDFGVPQHDNPLAESTADYTERDRTSELLAEVVKREFAASMPSASVPLKPVVDPGASQSAEPEPASKKNGNGHGHGYAALPEPYRLAKVVISRSGDSTIDASRVGEVHHLLSSSPGPDRFCFLIKARGETLQLDFPNDTTTLDEMMIDQLKSLHGVESVQVSMNL